MEVADVALYVALWRDWDRTISSDHWSDNQLLAQPPATQQIIAVCTLLKVGRTLATGEVRLNLKA